MVDVSCMQDWDETESSGYACSLAQSSRNTLAQISRESLLVTFANLGEIKI